MNDNSAPVIVVRGERVGLGHFRKDLVPLYHRWFNDLAVQRTTSHPRLIALESIDGEFDSFVQSESNQPFTIYELEDDGLPARPIGIANLKHVDHRDRTAEYEVVIGEPDARGKGYGTATTQLVLDYAFTVLSLRNVMLVVYANNPAGIRAYEKAGLREFGRRTAAVEVAGELFDLIYMEALAKDFDSPALRDIMLPPDSGR